jgi:hypothetical protein
MDREIEIFSTTRDNVFNGLKNSVVKLKVFIKIINYKSLII